MAINEWKIWQKLGIVKPKPGPEIDIDKDLDAVTTFFKETVPSNTLKNLLNLFLQMKKLREEEKRLVKANASEDQIKKNILEQVKVYDKILEAYELFELDIDVTAERVKKISFVLGKKAKETNIDPAWLEKIRKSERWTFDW